MFIAACGISGNSINKEVNRYLHSPDNALYDPTGILHLFHLIRRMSPMRPYETLYNRGMMITPTGRNVLLLAQRELFIDGLSSAEMKDIKCLKNCGEEADEYLLPLLLCVFHKRGKKITNAMRGNTRDKPWLIKHIQPYYRKETRVLQNIPELGNEFRYATAKRLVTWAQASFFGTNSGKENTEQLIKLTHATPDFGTREEISDLMNAIDTNTDSPHDNVADINDPLNLDFDVDEDLDNSDLMKIVGSKA